jgi:hypothetical protein
MADRRKGVAMTAAIFGAIAAAVFIATMVLYGQ